MIVKCDSCTRTCLLDLELPEGKKFGVSPDNDNLSDAEWMKQYDEWLATEAPHWDFLKSQGWSRKVVNWNERIFCPDCSDVSPERAKAKIDRIVEQARKYREQKTKFESSRVELDMNEYIGIQDIQEPRALAPSAQNT